jgi:hypothetical protein
MRRRSPRPDRVTVRLPSRPTSATRQRSPFLTQSVSLTTRRRSLCRVMMTSPALTWVLSDSWLRVWDGRWRRGGQRVRARSAGPPARGSARPAGHRVRVDGRTARHWRPAPLPCRCGRGGCAGGRRRTRRLRCRPDGRRGSWRPPTGRRSDATGSARPRRLDQGRTGGQLASAYVMLASEESGYITGALLAVSGRKSML